MKSILMAPADVATLECCSNRVEAIVLIPEIFLELGDEEGRGAGGLEVSDVFKNFSFLVALIVKIISTPAIFVFEF